MDFIEENTGFGIYLPSLTGKIVELMCMSSPSKTFKQLAPQEMSKTRSNNSTKL